MKKLSIRLIALVAMLSQAQSIRAEKDNCQMFDWRCYECSCNPLYEGAWDLQFQGGVAWLQWRHSGQLATVNCVGFNDPVVPLLDMPKYDTLFHIPWLVGGQVGYAFTDNIRAFVEFNYLQGDRKKEISLVTTNAEIDPAETLTFNELGKYKEFTAYFGGRYYWDRWCDRVSFFLGAKVGLTHHYRVNFGLNIASGTNPSVMVIANETPFFKSNTVISGGGHGGFDVCFWGNWSLIVTGEVVASAGPYSNMNINFTPPVGTTATNVLIGNIQTELKFPVTGAIRYSF